MHWITTCALWCWYGNHNLSYTYSIAKSVYICVYIIAGNITFSFVLSIFISQSQSSLISYAVSMWYKVCSGIITAQAFCVALYEVQRCHCFMKEDYLWCCCNKHNNVVSRKRLKKSRPNSTAVTVTINCYMMMPLQTKIDQEENFFWERDAPRKEIKFWNESLLVVIAIIVVYDHYYPLSNSIVKMFVSDKSYNCSKIF